MCALLLVIAAWSPLRAEAQDAMARVQEALSNGEAALLVEVSADRVEMALLGKRAFYSRAQALYVLEDFFQAHAPVRLNVQEAAQRGDSWFLRAQYVTHPRNRSLHVYARLRRNGAIWELRELFVSDGG